MPCWPTICGTRLSWMSTWPGRRLTPIGRAPGGRHRFGRRASGPDCWPGVSPDGALCGRRERHQTARRGPAATAAGHRPGDGVEAGLSGADDPTVLAWAAVEGRVLLTHDLATMTDFAYERVAEGR